MSVYVPVFQALNRAGARYVVVGGVATVLHGYPRFTADIDLIIDLSPDAASKAIEALLAHGLVARLPVDPKDFSDPRVRRRWVTEKHMQVFSMYHPENPLLSVDLFADHPIEFEALWNRSVRMDIGDVPIRIASIDDLIELKQRAGRPQDLIDIEMLERLKGNDES